PDATHTAADVALGRGPAESATLTGVDVPASELTARLAGQERLWLVTGPSGPPPRPETATDQAKLNILREDFTEVRREDVPGFRITLHVRRTRSVG
ncbi:MAG: mannosyltransferase, partial [Actinomycetota bacterium]|nr:mannosyltransferase [Actinomycetota bacterium]